MAGLRSTKVSPGDGVKPRLTLRAGIVGHRQKRIIMAGGDPALIRECIQDLLARLEVLSRDCCNQGAGFYREGRPLRRFATSLADGADLLGAQAAATQDWQVDIVLPFEQEAYFAEQDQDPIVQKELRELVGPRAAHRTYDLCAPHDGDAQKMQAYDAAAQVVLGQSDILFAVSDADPRQAAGLVPESVRRALIGGAVVIWILPRGSEAQVLLHETSSLAEQLAPKAARVENGSDGDEVDTGRFPSTDEVLSRCLTALLQPPTDEEMQFRMESFFGGRAKDKVGLFFNLDQAMKALARCKRPSRRRFASLEDERKGWETSVEQCKRVAGSAFAREIGDTIVERYYWTDRLASYFSDHYRSSYILNSILVFLSVAIGLFIIFWSDELALKALLVFLEFVCISCILALTIFGRDEDIKLWRLKLFRGRRWHQKWLDYRNIAELLRPARLLLMLGSAPLGRQAGDGADEESWVVWYVRATLREIGTPGRPLDRDTLRIALSAARDGELSEGAMGQLAYHSEQVRTLGRIEHTLHRVGILAFLLTGLIAIAYLASYLAECPLYGDQGFLVFCDKSAMPWTSSIKSSATYLAGILPVFGAALFAIRKYGDYELIRKQSKRTAEALERLRKEVGKELAKKQPTRRAAVQLFGETTQAMAEDLRLCALIYSDRDLALP